MIRQQTYCPENYILWNQPKENEIHDDLVNLGYVVQRMMSLTHLVD